MTETTTPVEETSSSSMQRGDLTAKLAACREKAGLNIEQAADEMHLSVNLLRSLEQEDFSHLPEPPYVRGYLRGYAKLADIDPSGLIRTYEALRGANPDEIAHHFAPTRSLGKVTEPAISPGTAKLIGVAFLAGIIALIAMIPAVRDWTSSTWESLAVQTAPPQVVRPAPALQTFTAAKDAEEKAATSTEQPPASPDTAKPEQTSAQTAETTPAATTEKTAATDTQREPQASSKPVEEATTATEKPAATGETTTATTTDTGDKPATTTAASTAASDADKPATTTDKTATTAGDTVQASGTESATADQASAETDTPTAPPKPIGGEVVVKLEFGEEVWMQVKDDKKKVLFESLNSSGTTKEFKATTPLDFKIGNAHGVKVYLNGQLYDQAAHIKGSVARFKVE